MPDNIATYRRDRPNDFRRHSDGSAPFSSFAVSDQLRRPTLQLAHVIVTIARRIAPRHTGEYAASFAINTRTKEFVFKPRGYPRQRRAVVEVINTDEKAAAIEFGSGEPSVGDSSGESRPQGGFNTNFRVLGRAAAKVGDFRE